MEELLTKALYYHQQYGWNILPVGIDKKPTLSSWVEYQNQKMTEEDIEGFFKNPTKEIKGIALITGKVSGITALDLDIQKEEGYPDPYKELNTPSVKTGSGGRHYYFKYREELPSTDFNYYENDTLKTEIKNNGRYLILPPSENQNGIYQWINDIENTELIEIPDYITDKIKKKDKQDKVLPTEETIKEGSRNTILFSELCSCIAKHRAYNFNPKDIELYARAKANEINKRCNPPMDIQEVENTILSALKTDKGNYPTYYENNVPEAIVKPIKALTKKEDSLFLNLGDRTKKVLGIETGYKVIDNYLKGFRGLTILAGEPKIGKSSFILQTSYQASLIGTPVIYLALEMSDNQIYRNIISQLAMQTFYDDNEHNIYGERNPIDGNEEAEVSETFSIENLEYEGQKIEHPYFEGIRDKIIGNENFYLVTIKELSETPKGVDLLKEYITQVKVQHNNKKVLVIVDMLNHFDIPNSTIKNDQNMIDDLKIKYFSDLVQVLDIAVVLVMQLNKEGQKSNKPNFTAIKGSTTSTYTAESFIYLTSKDGDTNEEDKEIDIETRGREVAHKTDKIILQGRNKFFNLEKASTYKRVY